MVDHVIDVLSTCRRIMDLARTCIDIRDFSEGSYERAIVDVILTEAQPTVQYKR